MVRVHVAPTATAKGELEVYRAPPLREAPSEQARLHVFPVAHLSTEKVIIEEIGGNDGGGGGDGGGEGGEGGDGGDGGASWLMDTSVFVLPEQYARHTARPCGGEDESSELKRAW